MRVFGAVFATLRLAVLTAAPASALSVTSNFDNATDGSVGGGFLLDPQAGSGDPAGLDGGGHLLAMDSTGAFGGVFAPADYLGTPFADGGAVSFAALAAVSPT